MKTVGTCTLVGAGPGDPELLTLKAVKAIQAATVILVDDLVSAEVLAYAKPVARIIQVGKRGGCKSTPQAFILKLMVSETRRGENVVRLKGGDPLIFGRGGEELQALQAAGIQATVVNGVTSALAAVNSLGVALTHRDHARGVVFITGHAKPGDAGPDWATLAASAHQARLTLVIYMGLATAAHIQQGLLGGLPADTPLAIVQNASLAHEQRTLTRLDQFAVTLDRAGIRSPAIIIVGDVLKTISFSAPALKAINKAN